MMVMVLMLFLCPFFFFFGMKLGWVGSGWFISCDIYITGVCFESVVWRLVMLGRAKEFLVDCMT